MKTHIQQKSARTILKHKELTDSQLFGIQSRKQIAQLLYRELPYLYQLLSSATPARYNIRPNTVKGKSRMVQVPRRDLKHIHRRLYCLLNQMITPDYVHSGQRGRSYVTNAMAHVKPSIPRALYKVDVHRFFESVRWEDVYGFFNVRMACSPDVSALLADICTVEALPDAFRPDGGRQRHLPTGSPVSQVLAYWCFASMFESLHKLATSRGLRMTVYVDDVAMSGPRIGLRLQAAANDIIARYNLIGHKERYWGLSRPGLVTGAIVATDGLRLPNSRRQEILTGVRELKKIISPRRRIEHLRVLVGQLWSAFELEPSFERMAREFNAHLTSLRAEHPRIALYKRKRRRWPFAARRDRGARGGAGASLVPAGAASGRGEHNADDGAETANA